MKMDKRTIKFDDTEIEEYKLYLHDRPIMKKGFKYFNGYKDDKRIRP